MAKKNEVAVQSEANVPAQSAMATDIAAWGGPTRITSNDIVIPKILVMQQMSEKVVKHRSAKFGELRDSINNKFLGGINEETGEIEGMEFVPFYMEKVFIEFEIVKNKRVYKRIVPIIDDPSHPGFNDNAPYEFSEGSVSMERDRTMNFYVLLPSEVKNKAAIPYIISFRRSSLRAGKKLATQMYMVNLNAGKIPPATTMELTVRTETNDDGTFCVLDLVPKRDSTDAEMAEAFKWLKPLSKKQLKVDDSDLHQETTTVTDTGEF